MSFTIADGSTANASMSFSEWDDYRRQCEFSHMAGFQSDPSFTLDIAHSPADLSVNCK